MSPEIEDLRERVVEAARGWYKFHREAELAGAVMELETALREAAKPPTPIQDEL